MCKERERDNIQAFKCMSILRHSLDITYSDRSSPILRTIHVYANLILILKTRLGQQCIGPFSPYTAVWHRDLDRCAMLIRHCFSLEMLAIAVAAAAMLNRLIKCSAKLLSYNWQIKHKIDNNNKWNDKIVCDASQNNEVTKSIQIRPVSWVQRNFCHFDKTFAKVFPFNLAQHLLLDF